MSGKLNYREGYMIYRLHELIKEKEDQKKSFAVSITLWPIDEVDLWIRDQSDPHDAPVNIFHANGESVDEVLLKAITFIEAR
jgi:hypothetical protein